MFDWRMEEEAKSEFTIAVNWHREEGSIATTHPPRDGRARHLGEFEAETRERNIIWKIHALPVVQADQALFRLVLVNLISNAVKFTGGRTLGDKVLRDLMTSPASPSSGPTIVEHEVFSFNYPASILNRMPIPNDTVDRGALNIGIRSAIKSSCGV